MKLKTKLLHITNAQGKEIDVDSSNVELYLNGKKHPLSLRDVISHAEYDDGEIYGNTLLSYFKVTDDGKLAVEGSEIELRDDKGEQVKVTRISRPGIYVDKNIPFEEVQKFAHDFSIEKPEEVFPDLNDEEKQVFIAEREKREAETAKQKAASAKALEEAEAARLAKEKEDQQAQEKAAAQQADKNLRIKVKPALLYNDKKYKSDIAAYYKAKGCTEYVKGPYRLWFGKDTEEEPCLFIQRGTANEAHGLQDWFEQPEPQQSYEGETPGILIIDFSDFGTAREMQFNTETGEIKVKQ